MERTPNTMERKAQIHINPTPRPPPTIGKPLKSRAPITYTKEQLKDMFWRYDTNKDGRLSRQELKNAFKTLGALIPAYRAHRALNYADENGDGYISDEEVDELVKYALQLGYKVY